MKWCNQQSCACPLEQFQKVVLTKKDMTWWTVKGCVSNKEWTNCYIWSSLSYDRHINKSTVSQHSTLNSAYNEKKYAEILPHYRQLFIKGDVFIGERGIFGVEISFVIADFLLKATSL